MSTVKNSLDDQDPDYTIPISTNKNPEEVCEENARTTARKITEIIEKEFSQEIDTKQNEVLQIQERLHKALKTLHLLRYVIITDFYNRKQCQASQTRETQQTRIHPAIKQLIGKSPKRPHNDFAVPSTSTDPRFLNGYSYPSPKRAATTEHNVIKTENTTESSKECNTSMQFKSQSIQDNTPLQKKIPRYIPPKSGLPEPTSPSRGVRHKVRKRIVIGNISKWIPQDWREDPASHKWTIYVQGSKEFPNIEDFVSKVRFFLHPSYKPNDVVEISSVPFNLSRRGWGEFPLRVQLHFKNPINKPMDIIHNLKLDRTFTGLQTLGSETVVDVWIYTMDPNIFIQADREICDSSKEEINSSTVNEEHKFDSMIIGTPQKLSTSIDSDTITVKSETNNLEVPNIDNKLYDMKSQIQLNVIKSEPIDEVPQAMSFMTNDNTLTSKCNSNTKELENMRFSVTHDHDYLNNSISNVRETNLFVENNITIKNLPDNSPIKKSINSTVELSGNNTNLIKQFSNNQHCTFNANTEKLVENNSNINDKCTKVGSSSLSIRNTIEEVIRKEHFRSSINETNKNTLCQMNFKSNLRPLQISIPPSFEPTAGKHMLILQNNKRTSTEGNNTCPSKVDTAKCAKNYNKINTNNCLSYGNSKTSILIPKGTSLLKKQVKQTGKPTTNNKNDNKYAILEIKPSNSLLLNLNSNVPALKIADNASYNMANLYNKNSSHLETSLLQKDQTFTKPINHNGKIGKSRIILGKDKWRLHSKEDLYKKDLKTIETAKITDVEGLLRFIIRRIPIVTPHASDPDYKRLHPYACATEKEYFNHNVGKRAAYEWWRAKTVRSFLRKKLTAEDKLWSVKEIILWARLYGYTPTRSCFGIDATTTTSGAKRLPCTEISATTSTCTEPIGFQKWLQTSYDASKNLTTDNDDSQEEDVDILTCQNPENNKTTLQNKIKFGCSYEVAKSNTISLNLEEELLPLHNFVCETTRSIGITLEPEEIFPNVLHCSASRVMIRAMECFVEDLVRTSLVKAWEKNNGKECPQTLSLDDVRSALMSREEFDIFTNEGLGSRYPLNTED